MGVAGGVALSIGGGYVQVGGVFFWAWIIGGGLQMIVGLAIAEGVSAYPLAGGSYQIINRILGGRSSTRWQGGGGPIIAHNAAGSPQADRISPFIPRWVDVTPHRH